MPEATIISRHSLLWAQTNNSIAARLVSLGTWNVVRVGILWGVTQDTPGTITPDFALGFCAGTAAVYGDASATHFVGITTEHVTFGGWAISSGFFVSQIFRPTKQVGVVKTNGGNLTAISATNASSVNNYRTILMVEITKGSPNYSFKLFYRNTTNANDYNVTHLTTVMEAAVPTLGDHTFSAAQTLAVDEGVDGTLTAAQIYWSLTTSDAEIDAIMVSKIS